MNPSTTHRAMISSPPSEARVAGSSRSARAVSMRSRKVESAPGAVKGRVTRNASRVTRNPLGPLDDADAVVHRARMALHREGYEETIDRHQREHARDKRDQ